MVNKSSKKKEQIIPERIVRRARCLETEGEQFSLKTEEKHNSLETEEKLDSLETEGKLNSSESQRQLRTMGRARQNHSNEKLDTGMPNDFRKNT